MTSNNPSDATVSEAIRPILHGMVDPYWHDDFEHWIDVCTKQVADAALTALAMTFAREQPVGEMAAFGASGAACYLYPDEDQMKERTAFCDGAAHAVSSQPVGDEGLRVELDKLLELGGDYAADVFNDLSDKTSRMALQIKRDIERFDKAQIALATSPTPDSKEPTHD